MRRKNERNEQISRRGFLVQTAKSAGRLTALGATWSIFHPRLDRGPSSILGRGTKDEGRATSDERRTTGWQIGCYTRPWAKYEYSVALDAIAEAGFTHVGLMTTKSKTGSVISVSTTLEEAEQVGQEVKKRGLFAVSVWGGDIPVAKSLEAGIEGLRKLIDNCAACGGKNLLMGGTGKKEIYEVYYKAIAECCDYAAQKGIGIGIKPHGGLNATGPQCRKTVEMVGHKNFRIWYDPGNILFYSNAELNPVADAATVDGLVVGMCIKDYKHPKDVSVTPGTGEVDFPAVLARLQKGGFTHGPLVVECLNPPDPSASLRAGLEQTLAEAKKARLFLEEITAKMPPSEDRRQKTEYRIQK